MGMEGFNQSEESAESLKSWLEQRKIALRAVIDEVHDINSNAGRFQVDSIKLNQGDMDQVRLKKYKEELKLKDENLIEELSAEIKEIEKKLATMI